jgi:hypothetical protein
MSKKSWGTTIRVSERLLARLKNYNSRIGKVRKGSWELIIDQLLDDLWAYKKLERPEEKKSEEPKEIPKQIDIPKQEIPKQEEDKNEIIPN